MNTKITEKMQLGTQKLISYGMWLMIVVLGFSVIQNAGKIIETRTQIQREKDKVTKMAKQNQDLERQIANSQSSTFIEKQMRDELGLALPNEAIVVLPDVDTLRKLAPQPTTENDTLPDPNWRKWEKLFF